MVVVPLMKRLLKCVPLFEHGSAPYLLSILQGSVAATVATPTEVEVNEPSTRSATTAYSVFELSVSDREHEAGDVFGDSLLSQKFNTRCVLETAPHFNSVDVEDELKSIDPI